MKIVGMIPARYNSSRFPGKLLEKIGNKTVIEHVCNNAANSNLEEFYVLTDNEKIYNLLNSKYNVLRTSDHHENGTSRITEVVEDISFDYILNIQGDEPFLSSNIINEIIDSISFDYDIFSLKTQMDNIEDINNINNVKVVCNKNNEALYFSRSKIPFDREPYCHYYKHIGLYVYSNKFLKEYKKLLLADIAIAESLEQLNFLYEGYKIKMLDTMYSPIGIDTKEDLQEARKIYELR